MNTSTKQKAALHGECMVFQSTIPAGAQPLAVGEYLIVADSETTGNHHVIENAEGCEFYELDGVRYMRNRQPATIRCLHEDRHDAITLDPGEWEFGQQQEYDYFTQSHRAVAD